MYASSSIDIKAMLQVLIIFMGGGLGYGPLRGMRPWELSYVCLFVCLCSITQLCQLSATK